MTPLTSGFLDTLTPFLLLCHVGFIFLFFSCRIFKEHFQHHMDWTRTCICIFSPPPCTITYLILPSSLNLCVLLFSLRLSMLCSSFLQDLFRAPHFLHLFLLTITSHLMLVLFRRRGEWIRPRSLPLRRADPVQIREMNKNTQYDMHDLIDRKKKHSCACTWDSMIGSDVVRCLCSAHNLICEFECLNIRSFCGTCT